MGLSLTMMERIERARADLRMGAPVVLTGPDHVRAFAFAAETLGRSRFEALMAFDQRPALCVTAHRARSLKAHVYDGDLARIWLPKEVSLSWVHAVADPAYDLRAPMKGPFQTARGGDVIGHHAALALAKSAHLLPAAVVVAVPKDIGSDEMQSFTHLPAQELLHALAAPHVMSNVVSANVPLAVSEAGRLHVFRPDAGGEEHYAVEIGRPARDAPVLTRLHSACFTGDLLGSLKCDCGAQLRGALAQMGEEGAGVLLYLNQEGRGIGLANKMRAYALQDQGFDTVEANHRLGFEDDERDFRLGAEILRKLGFSSVRLMTNNPAKIEMMTTCGLEVRERVPLKVGKTAQNAAYLATKAAKSRHML